MKVVVCPTKLLQILRENTCFVTAPFFVSLTLCMMLWPQNQERGTARTRLVLMNTAADVTNQVPLSKFGPFFDICAPVKPLPQHRLLAAPEFSPADNVMFEPS